MDYEFESIIPWNGEHDTGRDARQKLDRNFAKIKANFEELGDAKFVTTAFFARIFGIDGEDGAQVDINDTEAVITAVKVKFGLYSESFVSAKGKNPESGSEPGGATTLAALTDVSITTTPKDGQVLAYDATLNKWTPVDMEATAGIDEEELLQILTQKGYATQQWVTQQSYAKTSVRIKAGTGLTGGGTLAQDVTLSLATVGAAGTYTKVTVDAYGRVTGHASLAAGDIPALAISKITGLQAALDAKMDAADFEELFEKVWVSGYGYAIRAKLAFYSDDWISAKGLNSDAGSTTGGVDENEVLQIVENAGYIKSSALNGYATQTWVNQQGFLKSVAWGDVTGKPAPLANDQYYYGHGRLTTDFNDAVKGGAYFTASEDWPSNGPGTSYRYGALAVFHTGTDNMRVAQLWMSHSTSSAGGVYVRMKYEQADDNWQPWARLLDNNCIGSYALTPSNYTNYTVTKTGGGASGTWGIAVTGNAGSATRLHTARTLWGQPFDGTANVSGDMTGVGGITMTGTLVTPGIQLKGNLFVQGSSTPQGVYFTVNSSGDMTFAGHSNAVWTKTYGKIEYSTGNVGIGTTSPTYKLHVAGGIYSSDYLQVGSARLRWDSTNNALYVQKSDGSVCGFYATGFISAKGSNPESGSTVSGASALVDLSDVAIANPQDGQIFVWDAARKKWVNADAPSAGLDDVSISNPVDGQSLIYRGGVWKNETVNYGITMDVDWDDVKNKPAWIGSSKPSYSFSEITGTPSVTISSSSSTNLTVNVEGARRTIPDLYATYSTYADYLRTARTIWGQSFNGGSSVSGALTGVTTITASGNIKGSAFYLTTGGGLYWVNGTTYLDGREGENFQIRTSGGISIPTLTIYATTTKFNGTVYATGGFQNGSDIRYKHVLQDLALTVAQVAAAPSFLFRWTDGTADGVQAGTSAQYWQQVLPQVVMESAGRLSMQYDKAALAAAIATARAVADHETRIRRLEQQLDKTPASTP